LRYSRVSLVRTKHKFLSFDEEGARSAACAQENS
jgi:hypothetical protein